MPSDKIGSDERAEQPTGLHDRLRPEAEQVAELRGASTLQLEEDDAAR